MKRRHPRIVPRHRQLPDIDLRQLLTRLRPHTHSPRTSPTAAPSRPPPTPSQTQPHRERPAQPSQPPRPDHADALHDPNRSSALALALSTSALPKTPVNSLPHHPPEIPGARSPATTRNSSSPTPTRSHPSSLATTNPPPLQPHVFQGAHPRRLIERRSSRPLPPQPPARTAPPTPNQVQPAKHHHAHPTSPGAPPTEPHAFQVAEPPIGHDPHSPGDTSAPTAPHAIQVHPRPPAATGAPRNDRPAAFPTPRFSSCPFAQTHRAPLLSSDRRNDQPGPPPPMQNQLGPTKHRHAHSTSPGAPEPHLFQVADADRP